MAPGLVVAKWTSSDGLPWDVALVPLLEGGRIIPAVVLRPRPVPLLDVDALDHSFLAWQRDHTREFVPTHRHVVGWEIHESPAWPTLESLMANGDAAARHVQTRIEESPTMATSEVVCKAPWQFLVLPALTLLVCDELGLTLETAPRDVNGARLQAERDKRWPPRKRGWTPGADTTAFVRAAALLQLRDQYSNLGRLAACFTSGERSDKKDESQLASVKALSKVRKRWSHPLMQPLVVPVARDELFPDPRGSMATLAQWLLDGHGVRALQWMFGTQADRLAFESEVVPATDWTGLSVLQRGNLARIAGFVAGDDALTVPYLGGRLVFCS